jgi:hypothetical protein
MVDEIFLLLVMDWAYEVLVFMLLQPMLFIDIIVICSYDACTTNMLVTIHKRSLEKGDNAYKQKGRNYNMLYTILDASISK